MAMNFSLSIVLPAKNESAGLQRVLPRLMELHPDAEIIVVDDGSTDTTVDVVSTFHSVKCISHPVSIGNGGAIKTGARAASGEVVLFMDADGQHDPEDSMEILQRMEDGFDMVVGARSNESQASLLRSVANRFYNKLASWMTGFEIRDLTSGYRAVRREKFMSILYLLPNKFSYPTTSTMAFFKSGYFVDYIPIEARKREGKSHISLLHDGIRFMVIILKVGALYSPMRVFLPISLLLFYIASLYYLYTYSSSGRFTNMGMLLYVSSLLTFLIGLVSEQVSSLHYKETSLTERQ